MGARCVLGLGGTVDYEVVWDTAVVEKLVAEHGIVCADLDAGRPIADERDLLCTMLAFARDGVGGERFVASSDTVTAFARHFDVRVTLGGTCVRAAIAMDRVGLPSTVHLVSIDDTVRRLLPASTDYVCSADEDSLDPHLVVQFPAGERVALADGEITTPHANRIIYVNDPPNRELVIDEGLGDEIAEADLVMLSGFNVIQDRDVLESRLADVRRHLARRTEDSLVYFEDAGYHVHEFSARVRDALAGAVDVWAMNEDELQGWLGRDVDLLDAGGVAAALYELAEIVPSRVRMVHTKHWAIAHGDGAADLRAALRGGITMAAARYVHGDVFTVRELEAMRAESPGPKAAAFAERLADVDPDLVCEAALSLAAPSPTTIGLGDTFVGGVLTELARGVGGGRR
ncbi:ADP-dependent glucokinase/phosphofructokinase [Isoptericola sp. F-RaC21]|uniref:ADP-dependent glucokinase/phosphofructokinase n=1 Tax=Isoptericola sp. F-RaC21 TaxID=3141452 RepID=UPI00315B652D